MYIYISSGGAKAPPSILPGLSVSLKWAQSCRRRDWGPHWWSMLCQLCQDGLKMLQGVGKIPKTEPKSMPKEKIAFNHWRWNYFGIKTKRKTMNEWNTFDINSKANCTTHLVMFWNNYRMDLWALITSFPRILASSYISLSLYTYICGERERERER